MVIITKSLQNVETRSDEICMQLLYLYTETIRYERTIYK